MTQTASLAYNPGMRYRLRTLLIAAAVLPPLLAWFAYMSWLFILAIQSAR